MFESNLVSAITQAVEALESAGIKYALIGGLATGLRSRPRSTRDVDLLLSVPQIQLPGLLDNFRKRGFSFDNRTAIEQYLRQHLTFLDFHGSRVDWMKPMVPAYQHVLDTASCIDGFGTRIRTATAEGLVLLKLIAFRNLDIADIDAILAANQGQLDLAWIEQEWNTLFNTDDPRWQKFRQSLTEYYEPSK